jgi:MoxR-like ATPase
MSKDIGIIKTVASRVIENIAKVIVGKEEVAKQALICIIGGGHMLLEDVPGTGKTLFMRTLAKSIGCSFSRIQFTPDLLPSDVTGIHYYSQKDNAFILRKGPVFTHILLADEINRATPRTQSALLECMEERQVSIDNETLPLSAPFFVAATQNPVETHGTFPLPEAQLDRFLIKTGMGYPSRGEARLILQRFDGENPIDGLKPVADAADLLHASETYPSVHISGELLDYIIEIAEHTRCHKDIWLGVSPRGTLALMKASKILAAIEGRDYVLPDDIKAMSNPVLSHRMVTERPGVLGEILSTVPVPKS